jgi:hypothetical protein
LCVSLYSRSTTVSSWKEWIAIAPCLIWHLRVPTPYHLPQTPGRGDIRRLCGTKESRRRGDVC